MQLLQALDCLGSIIFAHFMTKNVFWEQKGQNRGFGPQTHEI